VFQRFGLDPADTLFTDDSPVNVAAAAQAEMDAVLYTGPAAILSLLGLAVAIEAPQRGESPAPAVISGRIGVYTNRPTPIPAAMAAAAGPTIPAARGRHRDDHSLRDGRRRGSKPHPFLPLKYLFRTEAADCPQAHVLLPAETRQAHETVAPGRNRANVSESPLKLALLPLIGDLGLARAVALGRGSQRPVLDPACPVVLPE
jgi:hypothetical protein